MTHPSACIHFERHRHIPRRAERDSGPDNPPSAPPTIPPIIINPFNYGTPAPAIDPRVTPDKPPLMPPGHIDIRLAA